MTTEHSQLSRDTHGARLDLLATGPAMTPQGLVGDATFFTGFVTRPDITASGLLAVADVAGSRYADAGLAQKIKEAMDPVVTAGGDRLRFESFSTCNGVHARFDLLREGLGSSEVGFGTTNVDINLPLRAALARVDPNEALHFAVGQHELRASSPVATHVEPKVALPDRWVRGLAESARLLASMEPVGSLSGAEARVFFGTLPRVAAPGPELHVLPLRGGWRTTTRPLPGSIPVFGVTRLRGSDRVLRHTERLTVHRHEHGSTAWVFDLPGGSLTLALSPGLYRGFSAEGTLLTLLTHPEAEVVGRRVLHELGWSPVVDQAKLAARAGIDRVDLAAGLAWLAASGRLGYDLREQAWFHRELPVDSDQVLRRNPRLVSAQRLLDSGGVAPGAAVGEWRVRGSQGATFDVTAAADQLGCTCPWELEHHGTRGPCKHVLAVLLELRS
jgi:hypothetical protein